MHLLHDEKLVAAVLADPANAPVAPKLRAGLLFVEKLTTRPTEIGPADVQALLAAGVSKRGVEEAIYVAFLFNTIDRIADAFDFDLTPPGKRKWIGRILSGPGYKMASVPG